MVVAALFVVGTIVLFEPILEYRGKIPSVWSTNSQAPRSGIVWYITTSAVRSWALPSTVELFRGEGIRFESVRTA